MAGQATPVIGLEVHIQLATESGMFCGCPAQSIGQEPNTQTCPVCLGLPGALPVPNKKAIEWALMLGSAVGGEPAQVSKFDRKHYFYPDLPKGYQISQYDQPLATGGSLVTADGLVRIRRIHIEEDTGRLQHTTLDGKKVSLVDFNRSGVPLVEIVTEPDITSSAQAKDFAQLLQRLIRALGISDCDMENGTMRLEADVSLGLDLGYKVEVKNLNSFRFLEKAIIYEISRQEEILKKGNKPVQETRGWSESRGVTFSQRVKETEADYRYFPEPDIPPMEFSADFIANLKAKIPELHSAKVLRFVSEFGIKEDYAKILTASSEQANYSETVFDLGRRENIPLNSLASIMVNQKHGPMTTDPKKVINLAKNKFAQKITDQMQLEKLIKAAIVALPQAVSDYKAGKGNALAVVLGKVMQLSQGKADPKVTRDLLTKML